MSSGDGKKFTFIWSIKNYSHLCCGNGQNLTSPAFFAENAGGSQWCIEIYPKGFDVENGEFIACFLRRNEDGFLHEEIEIDFALDIIGGNGENMVSFQFIKKTVAKGERFGCLELAKIKDIESKAQSWCEDVLKIRCSLISYQPIATEYIALTTIQVNFCSFDWSVSTNSSSVVPKDFDVCGRKFCIKAISNDSNISITVEERDNKNQTPYQITSDITLLYVDGVTIMKKRHVFFLTSRSWDKKKWTVLTLEREELSPPKQIKNSKQLLLACKFYLSSTTDFSKIIDYKSDLSSSLATLQDMRTLHLDEKHADVKLRTNNQVISAHRSVLVARSPVFSDVFGQETTETKTGTVEVPGVDPDTLRIFLEFLYTGEIEEFEYDSALKLLAVADKYQVSSLTEFCSSYLISKLTAANVCEVICSADMIHQTQLKISAMNFVANHAAAVMGSSEWDAWVNENQSLSKEIISNIITNFRIVPKNKFIEL